FYPALNSVGSWALTATDSVAKTITGSHAGIADTAGAFSQFTLKDSVSSVTAGGSVKGTVAATDAGGNVIKNYSRPGHFSSNGSQAGLPGAYTFVAKDKGVHVFTLPLKTAGRRTLTVTDTGAGAQMGTSPFVLVKPATATHFSIVADAGTAFLPDAVTV